MPKNINIDLFNFVTLKVLNDLYSAFPAPIQPDPAEYYQEFFESGFTEDQQRDMTAYPHLKELPANTISWLQQEGFIREVYDTKSFTMPVGHVTLTMNGFAVLGITPKPLAEGEKPLIDRIQETLAGGLTDAVREGASELVRSLFGAMLRVIDIG